MKLRKSYHPAYLATVLAAVGAIALGAPGCATEAGDEEESSEAAPLTEGKFFDRVTSAATLIALENGGFNFGALVPGTRGIAVNNRELSDRNAAYKDILATVAKDVDERMRKDPSLGVNTLHRTVDQRMLTSPEATFELVAVMNRADQGLRDSTMCGVVRFVYRLAYAHKMSDTRVDKSRLPMTFAVDYRVNPSAQTTCRAYENRWRGDQSFDALTSKTGPLSGEFIRRENFQHIEMNVQVQTWPSSAAPMGAFGEYVLRVFNIDSSGRAQPKLLLNTPDVSKLQANANLKNELKGFIKSNIAALERGTVTIPDKFLTTVTTSFTPGGLNRLSNRAYNQLFTAGDFGAINGNTLHSAEELMVRLNDLTCAGCHAGHAVNGFHMLGEERPSATHKYNTLVVGWSEHSKHTQSERVDVVRRIAVGEPTNSVVLAISVKPPSGGANYGQTCALDAHAKSGGKFEGWKCRAGLTCQQTDEPSSNTFLGKCFPQTLGHSGDPCNMGRTLESADPTKERLAVEQVTSCGGISQCSNLGGGFPGGMCRRECSELDRSVEACGPIASDGFNECLGDPNKTFVDCLNTTTAEGGRSRCDANRPCRQDYFCAKSADTANEGACVPSYFFFQLGMDAHPTLYSSVPTINMGFSGSTGQKKARGKAGGELVLKRVPLQSAQLTASDICRVNAGASVGITRVGPTANGHTPIELEGQSCPNFPRLAFAPTGMVEFF